MRKLDPKDVLIDLFAGPEFDHEIVYPNEAAKIVIQRLEDAGFKIVGGEPGEMLRNQFA